MSSSPNFQPDPDKLKNHSFPEEETDLKSVDLNIIIHQPEEFVSALQTVLKDIQNKNPRFLTRENINFLQQIGLIETEAIRIFEIQDEQNPYFQSDHIIRKEIFELKLECEDLVSTIRAFRCHGVDFETYQVDKAETDGLTARVTLQEKWKALEMLQEKLRTENEEKNFKASGIFVRSTEFAVKISGIIQGLSGYGRELFSNINSSAIKLWNIEALRFVYEHVANLVTLEKPDRHLRKFLYNFQDPSFAPVKEVLNRMYKLALTDQNIDIYLAESAEGKLGEAARWLRSRDGANYCPPPFPSWTGLKDQVTEESRKVVIRSRHHSYSFERFAAEARRGPDGSPSLLSQFIVSNFEDSKAVFASNNNLPPGKGFYFSGPVMEKLFFSHKGSLSEGIKRFRDANTEWLAQAMDYFEETTFLSMRGSWGVINNSDEFSVDVTSRFETDSETGEQVTERKKYAYLPLNDHLTQEYAPTYLYPTSLLAQKLKGSLYEIGENPIKGTKDICLSGLDSAGLFRDARAENLPVLNLSWCSTLFGSCAYSYPAMSGRYLEWERKQQHVIWKDINNHVHSSYRIFTIQHDKKQCDLKLQPLQTLHRDICSLANKYQALLELLFNRYAAWKNDQTPGMITGPRMLLEAYKRHKFADKVPYQDMDILCLIDKSDYAAAPIPVIDTIDMRLLTETRSRCFPRFSDGTGEHEIEMWNRYVKPHLFYDGMQTTEGKYALTFMRREYVR